TGIVAQPHILRAEDLVRQFRLEGEERANANRDDDRNSHTQKQNLHRLTCRSAWQPLSQHDFSVLATFHDSADRARLTPARGVAPRPRPDGAFWPLPGTGQ